MGERPLQQLQHVLGFALAMIVYASRLTDAAKVRPQHDIAQLHERTGQGLRHLVVETAAIQRMRMSHQRQAAWLVQQLALGAVDDGFDIAGSTGDQLSLHAGQTRSRSTTWPCCRCCSMISSTSLRST